jgi:MFS family permease
MIAAGIQMVLVPYLLAIQMNQSASRFGMTQMVGQLPILLFLLVGGWLADRADPRRVLMTLNTLAITMPLVLLIAVWRGFLSETLVLLYALTWGLVSAFVMPARDGLLRHVAGQNVQRMVAMALGMQFGAQMLGQALGGRGARWGAVAVLAAQCLALVAGIFVASRLPKVTAKPEQATLQESSLWRDLNGGLSVIFASPTMRATFLMTIGMGVFFGGVFMVMMPLAIRDLYAGSSADIANGYMTFGAGTLISIMAVQRRGGLRRPGRGLTVALLAGALMLMPIALVPPQWLFYLCVFGWGLCAGVAMTMSRTILQEHAPASHQSRVMAAFSLSSVGGGPLGSLIMGSVISSVGVTWSVVVPILGVTVTTLAVLNRGSIWSLRSRSHGESRT